MDSYEWNKVFGWVLATVLAIVGLNIVVGKWMAPHQSGKPGMAVEVAETPDNSGPVVAEVKPDWGTVIPAADAAAGEKVFSRCATCHDIAKGGANKVGPAIYGVVGAKHAFNSTFTYSGSMKALADKTWGYDELDAFLKNPKGAVPGTKMSFAGLSKQQDRINVIAFLRTHSDSPLAIPAPNPVAPPAPAAPTDGATEPAGEVQAPPPGATPAATPGATPAAPTPAAPSPAAPAAPAPAPAAPGH